MIRVNVLEDGRCRQEEGCDAVFLPEGDTRVWIDVTGPTEEDRQILSDRLDLHELAIRDAFKQGHPPKIEDFGDHLFLIAHTPVAGETEPTRKIAIFLGPTWIVSVTLVAMPQVAAVRDLICHEPERYLSAPERVAHALLDHVIRGFEERVDKVVDRVEVLEDRVIEKQSPDALEHILLARRVTSRLDRVMRAQRDMCHALSRSNHSVLSRRITPYLRDLYDHCLRINDHLQGVRESLTVARDAYLSSVNNRLSETMRVLTVIATIMMPLSLVAGIFGMNFSVMPGLQSPLGFWVTVAVMLAIALGMLGWFRRRGWV